MSTKIAALFVQRDGAYYNLPDVDPWDEERNALLYDGPYSVVAHPPCARWCRLAALVEKRWGYKQGDDGGTFDHALKCVRKFGGVLEHPAYSKAFAAHGLQKPAGYFWQRANCGGWVCQVDQHNYGHAAKKATWLYVYGATVLPDLAFRTEADGKREYPVSWCGNRTRSGAARRRMSSKETSATPLLFRDVLIAIARMCNTKWSKK